MLGENVEQLCIQREMFKVSSCHPGRNKVTDHIRKNFFWPFLMSDVAQHCRSCETCQKISKQHPKVLPMQEREVVTIPSERVCIDLVVPFPTAKEGYQFLLTYIDMATRWLEVIPLRKTTTRIVIDQLKYIFSRNGFPTTNVSDKGPQFTGKMFGKFLRDKGIEHVKSSQYHPQGNGVVEDAQKVELCHLEKKGNWAEIVPMALYFLRCTPNRSAGISPFLGGSP